MAGVVLVIFCFWFGLGILFDKSIYTRLMSVLLPVSFFAGFGMFGAFLPYNVVLAVVMSLIFGVVLYTLFLVENVFLVAIGYKTVPLYRAAYTVSLIVLLISAFFMFDTLFSYRLGFIANGVGVFLISLLLFLYQFWAVAIELPDDGANKNLRAFVIVPAILMTEIAVALSFWPTGIFKGSVYLVSVIYIFASLIQAEIRDRLFRRTLIMYGWVGVSIILAMLVITRWR
jgi:hypothetical protein